MEQDARKHLKPLNHVLWELPKTFRPGMRVPVRLVATEKLLEGIEEGVFEQAINVAFLPGIVEASWVMPDAHWGYGFPIGGVAAFDLDEGVVSPGGIGFDINCGMRLLVTELTAADLAPKLTKLVDRLFTRVPVGVGRHGFIKLSPQEFLQMLIKGAGWAIENGFGWNEDKERMEEHGAIAGADPEAVSERAVARGVRQLGTLGSGNHYLEVQRVEKVFNPKAAKAMGITGPDQIVVMIHSGSRGFGHQVATDYLRTFEQAMAKYKISVPDRQLACAPVASPEGKRYYSAMIAAANFGFCNRQLIAHRVREVFEEIFERSARDLGLELVYDVAHNIAKIEDYLVDGEKKNLLVHRKGATRSFGAGEEELPEIYRGVGQPVIIGGSMETGSYLLLGSKRASELTFGSTAHGSGRTMSRTRAKKMVRGQELEEKMKTAGIYVRSASWAGLAEEAGFAYKDITEVVRAVEQAGISTPVASFRPMGNIKG